MKGRSEGTGRNAGRKGTEIGRRGGAGGADIKEDRIAVREENGDSKNGGRRGEEEGARKAREAAGKKAKKHGKRGIIPAIKTFVQGQRKKRRGASQRKRRERKGRYKMGKGQGECPEEKRSDASSRAGKVRKERQAIKQKEERGEKGARLEG